MAYTQWLPYRSTTPGPWAAGPWEFSSNAGASYAPYSGANSGQVVGPAGTQRYRALITIPAGLSGSWAFTAQGDLWENLAGNNNWTVVYDGVTVGTGFQFNELTVTLPVTAGPHDLQVWASAESSTSGLTQLRLASPDYGAVVDPSEPDCQCWVQSRDTGAVAP